MEKANIVDVEFLAKFYRVDERTIQNWAKEFEENSAINIPVRYEKGQYDFVKFVHAKNLHYEQTIKKLELGDESLYELQKEYQRLRNKEKALDVANKENENINRELVSLAWKSEVHLFGKSIRALPGLLATMIPDESTYELRYNVTRKHTYEILNEIANTEIIDTEQKLERELEGFDNQKESDPEETEG